MTRYEILQLSPPERLAGYLLVKSRLAVLGARLRKDDRQDDTWSVDEVFEWEAISDEIDDWNLCLSPQDIVVLQNIEWFVSDLTCGVYPNND